MEVDPDLFYGGTRGSTMVHWRPIVPVKILVALAPRLTFGSRKDNALRQFRGRTLAATAEHDWDPHQTKTTKQ